MKRIVLLVGLVMSCPLCAQAPTETARSNPEPRFVAARKAGDPEVAPLLAEAVALAEHGADGAALLATPALQSLREVTEFRQLVRDRAPRGDVVMTSADEPGKPLRVEGTVRDSAGKPLANALLYAYHTSAKGWYADRAPHYATEGTRGGDANHARLFAYVRTDDQGRFVLRTIRPGGYPRSTLPQHIHWHLAPATSPDRDIAVGEVWFDDDPRLTAELRQRASASKDTIIVTPQPEGDGFVVRPVLVIDAARLESAR